MRSNLTAPAFRAAATALLWAVAVSVLSIALPAPTHAQTPRDDADEMERPEVRELRFRGVRAVDEGGLREALGTQASHCLGLLYRPICAVSKSPYFYERRYLDRAEFRLDVVRILVYYYRRGWRDARVDTAVVQVAPNAVRIEFEVIEGEPTLVDTAFVDGAGATITPQQRRRVLQPRPGEPLNLLRLDSSVVRLRTILWNEGYGDAAVDRPEIAVDDSTNRARVRVPVRPGPKTTIGTVSVVHLRGDHKVSDETIRNSLTFESGDLFRRSEVARSQRLLYESGLFRSAVIDTALARDAATGRTVCAQQSGLAGGAAPAADTGAAPDSTKDVAICVLEGTLREARVSGGFTTADFFTVEGRYTNNYWTGGGRQLTLTGVVGNLGAKQLFGTFPFTTANGFNVGTDEEDNLAQASRFFVPTYQLGAEVRQRWFRSPRNTIALGAFTHRRSSPGVYVDRGLGGNLTFTRNLAARSPASATYRFEVSRVEAGDVYFCVSFGVCDAATIGALQGQQRLSPLALTFSSSTANDPLSPTTGYIARAEANHASAATVSDFRYNRAQGELSMYYRATRFGLPRRSVLAGHVRVGIVRALGSTNRAVGGENALGDILHPRTRFYAGGSRSVRGFGENQLGPRVLTIAPELLRGREGPDTAPTFSRCPLSVSIMQCGDSLNAGSLPDRDFVPRPLGGTSLIEGSVELRVPVWGPVTVAAFVDGAIVGESSFGDLANATSAITPGFGVRYRSPVGPIRVDVGYRPRLPEALPVITEERLADGSRRLVPLSPREGCSTAPLRCRTFDSRSADGFFQRLADRMTLHLSIGEAF